MLLMLELGEGRWKFKVPVLVSDLDLECKLWLKLRLAPMCPWIGTISLAFVGSPTPAGNTFKLPGRNPELHTAPANSRSLRLCTCHASTPTHTFPTAHLMSTTPVRSESLRLLRCRMLLK